MSLNKDELKRFMAAVLEPEEWNRTAKQLRAAAELLELETHLQLERLDSERRSLPKPRCSEKLSFVMLMLNAFALENFFKGYIVRTDRERLRVEIQKTT